MQKSVRVYGFPSSVDPEAVKDLMELYTGKGTVYAVEINQAKAGDPRTSAKVQFTTQKAAETFVTLAKNKKLVYGNSYLMAWEAIIDIIPKPRLFLHGIDGVTLYLGCPVSEESFSVLWDCENVSVKFGLGMKNLHFFLSCLSVQYKLELFPENIWQIELRQPHGQGRMFLLIKVRSNFSSYRYYSVQIKRVLFLGINKKSS